MLGSGKKKLKKLKGSYDNAKITLFCVTLFNVFTPFKVHKTLFSTYLNIIVAPLCPGFLKCVDFYKAHCSEKRGVL